MILIEDLNSLLKASNKFSAQVVCNKFALHILLSYNKSKNVLKNLTLSREIFVKNCLFKI